MPDTKHLIIQQILEMSGFTLEELAEKLKINHGTLHRIRMGYETSRVIEQDLTSFYLCLIHGTKKRN